MAEAKNPPSPATTADWVARILAFITLMALIFTQPAYPEGGLDSSWRMALSYFFQEGRQFGTEVVFTYGPLGFLMGKTYAGYHYGSFILWFLLQAVVYAGIIFWQGYKLHGYPRYLFFVFFFIYGVSYEDALQQAMLTLVGMELIRRSGGAWRFSTLAILALMSVLALVKFTNLMLSLVLIGIATGLDLWQRKHWNALRLPPIFIGLFLLGWLLCGQNPMNLPAYVGNSWEISQGYQNVMGLPAPDKPLRLGLIVLGLLILYAAIFFFTQRDRIRALALALGLGAFVYLNWKHGFVRADGHMIGFFYSAMLVAVIYPALLQDGPVFRIGQRIILAIVGCIGVLSIDIILPGLGRTIAGEAQQKVFYNVAFALNPSKYRSYYQDKLRQEKAAYDLMITKAVVGDASVDVLGHEQSIALYNGLNYRPRPVLQGYSAYTPKLAALNQAYYLSDQAPDYVLFKLQTIDDRPPMLDDPFVVQLLMHRYTYVHTEKGFQLWRRKPGGFDAAATAPQPPFRTQTVQLGESLNLADVATEPLWLTLDVQPNLLGRLRAFFYKPPLVKLRLTDQWGKETLYRVPMPMGRAGFMVNPFVEDIIDYMQVAGGRPDRRLHALTIEVAAQDRDCFQPEVALTLARVPTSDAGVEFLHQTNTERFHMFDAVPVTYEALGAPAPSVLDERDVIIMHAPSEMIFDVPGDSRNVSGAFGFIHDAYLQGRTNGAEFIVSWSDGGEPKVLMQRFLDPLQNTPDRGLQEFSLALPASYGRLYFRITPGPQNEFAWDWTVWTGITFE